MRVKGLVIDRYLHQITKAIFMVEDVIKLGIR